MMDDGYATMMRRICSIEKREENNCIIEKWRPRREKKGSYDITLIVFKSNDRVASNL